MIVTGAVPKIIARYKVEKQNTDYAVVLGTVYYQRWNTNSPTNHFKMVKVEEMNAKTFVSAGSRCIKDEDTIFCGIWKAPNADVETFLSLPGGGWRDKDQIVDYEHHKDADPVTFEAIFGEIYAKDKNHVYYNAEIMPGVDPESFKILSTVEGHIRYVTDSKNIYCPETNEIIPISLSNFEVLNSFYAKNSTQALYKCSVFIPGDTGTLVALKYEHAKDSQNVYYEGRILMGADPKTYELTLNSRYTKDKDTVFYHDRIVQNADPKTFVPNRMRPEYSKDINRFFLEDKEIPESEFKADPV